MLSNCGVGEDSWESLVQQRDQTSQSERKSVLNIHWKDRCWSWSSNPLATWCKELTHWKRPWCWERLRARGKGDDRGWDGWMASLTQWTWVWANSGRQWRAGKPGVLQFMGLQRVGHDWLKNNSKKNLRSSKYLKQSKNKSWQETDHFIVAVQSPSFVQLLLTPWTAAHQASLSLTISRSLPKFSTSPSNEYLGLISLRMDWLDLLAVQGTLKSLLQHHSSKASILRHSASFFYSPTLTSIHDHWKSHSLDYIDLCRKSDVSTF